MLILIASPDQKKVEHWEKACQAFEHIFCVKEPTTLKHSMQQFKPPILLLDHDLILNESTSALTHLYRISSGTKIVLLSHLLNEQVEWELFKAGARGFCKPDIKPEQLQQILQAILNGELWIRRAFTTRLLAELETMEQEKNQMKQAIGELLSNLTEREAEIVNLVGGGDSNKQIAHRLQISERTVKAHLTEIFRKLHVSDRLNLALLVTNHSETPPQTDNTESKNNKTN